MTINPYIALADALNPGGYCPELCSHGGACTRPPGHEGNHQAVGLNSYVHCEWTPDGTEVPPGPKKEDA